MMQAVGVVLLAFGGAYMGFHAAGELSRRAALQGNMAASLALLEQELELGGYELKDCFRTLADRGGGEEKNFFSACAAGMEELEAEPFPSLWSRLAGEMPIGEEGQRILAALGETLGRCEASRQRQALRLAAEALTRLSEQTREQYRRQGKVFQAVGVSGGAFLAILLL